MGKVGRLLSVYGVKLHMLCATNRVPISYEPTAANTAGVQLSTRSFWRRRSWERR